MGTPELASHVLQAIVNNGFQIVAAVTAPDRPAGRGRKIRQSPVKELADGLNIPVLQPENLKSPEFISRLKSLKPDIQVVVAFRMLPESVWAIPPKGTFNLHASLLPDYRGAAPINWTIINGEKESGVTTFLLDHQIDTGKILFQKKIPLQTYETAGSLHEKVKTAGAELVVHTINALNAGTVKPMHQEELVSGHDQLHKAPKIHKEDCRINWDKSSREVVNHIHGLSPVPGAFCEVKVKQDVSALIKIYHARPMEVTHDHEPGKLLTDNKSYIRFTTGDGMVEILELQLPGKKRMSTKELLRGMQFE
ncbi:MAG: methionyl-tRNA formyltransferase [Bacteroidia bacterium]|nr:MAG: methionyl-tRNA formyltransferase [Bacteroidia bacterium]